MGDASGQGGDGLQLVGMDQTLFQIALHTDVLGEIDKTNDLFTGKKRRTTHRKGAAEIAEVLFALLGFSLHPHARHRTKGACFLGTGKQLMTFFPLDRAAVDRQQLLGGLVGPDHMEVRIKNQDRIDDGIIGILPLLEGMLQLGFHQRAVRTALSLRRIMAKGTELRSQVNDVEQDGKKRINGQKQAGESQHRMITLSFRKVRESVV